LKRTLPAKRPADLNPVHGFRRGCAVRMLASSRSIVEIKNRLGHRNVESTMVYLNPDVSALGRVRKRFEQYAEPIFAGNAQIEEMIDWENRQKVVAWLDSLRSSAQRPPGAKTGSRRKLRYVDSDFEI
jgi:hypothetical protein